MENKPEVGEPRAFIRVIAEPAGDPIAELQRKVIQDWAAEQLDTPTVMAGLNALFQKGKADLTAKAVDNPKAAVVESSNRTKTKTKPRQRTKKSDRQRKRR